ncbi:M24 family metallopeptidase [Aliiroseovarius sp. YM-037]|uniref:M24 family metallopeptidase n=1 Tax=Aliiroseovarius sp. YM-037 TaxID=3341728 RepID=UPI003A802D26
MVSSPRGFDVSEYQGRVNRAQTLMGEVGLDAILLTTEPDFRYFTGFLTRFWESPTRPWFLIVPASGDPVCIIPSIGAALMAQAWVEDVRTWQSPDLVDDGVSLLAQTLRDVVGASGRVGLPSGSATHLRMPLADYARLKGELDPIELEGDAEIMQRLRLVKSDAEIAKIRSACQIADRAFARVPEIAAVGRPLDDVFRRFQMLCLEEGADNVPYLAGAAGQGGYGDVISPATAELLMVGDVLMLDTGLTHDGYFCDFDRNFAIDTVSAEAASAHAKLIDAAAAGMDAAKPGATAADLFRAMDQIVTGGSGTSAVGRLGHGLGMQLTEWPSLIPEDQTELCDGMVLTLEPSIEVGAGRMLVHEENIVIRCGGAEFLSTPSGPAMAAIE